MNLQDGRRLSTSCHCHPETSVSFLHVLQHRPQNFPSLLERRLGPFSLRLSGFGNGSVDAIWSGWINVTEQLSGSRIVALNSA